MQYRELGKTGLKLPVLSFGASSLGQEFRPVDVTVALKAVRAALDVGMTFIDTSPYYGRGMSEVLLGSGFARCTTRILYSRDQIRTLRCGTF